MNTVTKKSTKTPTKMTILAIDPGSVNTGIAVLDADWGESGYIVLLRDSRLWNLSSEAESKNRRRGLKGKSAAPRVEQRLAILDEFIENAMVMFAPQMVVIEEGFARGRNATKALDQARGVLMAIASTFGAEVMMFAPTSVKKAVTGSGKADKKEVAEAASLYLKADLSRLSEDETDAVAVGICAAKKVIAESKKRGGA